MSDTDTRLFYQDINDALSNYDDEDDNNDGDDDDEYLIDCLDYCDEKMKHHAFDDTDDNDDDEYIRMVLEDVEADMKMKMNDRGENER